MLPSLLAPPFERAIQSSWGFFIHLQHHFRVSGLWWFLTDMLPMLASNEHRQEDGRLLPPCELLYEAQFILSKTLIQEVILLTASEPHTAHCLGYCISCGNSWPILQSISRLFNKVFSSLYRCIAISAAAWSTIVWGIHRKI